jgi:ABC-type transport system substrate-binding protein
MARRSPKSRRAPELVARRRSNDEEDSSLGRPGFRSLATLSRDGLAHRAARSLSLTAIAVLVGAGATACTRELPAPIGDAFLGEPVRGGRLELATLADVRSLDPALIASGVDAAIASHVYAGLVDVDADGHVVPVLAARIEELPATATVRVFLRPDLRFHDGAPVDAASIERSFLRLLAPNAGSVSTSFSSAIRGVAAYQAGASDHVAGLVVEGPLSFRFELERYDASFVPSLTLVQARPVCPSARPPGDPLFEPCGTGPFKLAPGGFVRGESVTLDRFDGWFEAPYPLLDGVRWRLQVPPRMQEILFVSGDLHVTRDLGSSSARRFLDDARWRTLRAREAATTFWGEGMNTELAPFDNVEVRRAIAAAIDRDAIVAIDPLRLRVGTGPLPPGAAGFDAKLRCQGFDRSAALEHMRKAGFPYDPVTRTGGLPRMIPYLATARTFAERSVSVLQAQLAAVGIRIAPKLVSYSAYVAATHRRGAVAMAPVGWTQDYPDPSNFFDALYATRGIDANDATNTSFYANARVDELLENAHHEADSGARARLFDEVARTVCDDAPIAFTHVPEAIVLQQGFVRDLRAHPVWLQSFDRAWLAPRTATSMPTMRALPSATPTGGSR